MEKTCSLKLEDAYQSPRRIPVELSKQPYEIIIGKGALHRIGEELLKAGIKKGVKILVVTNNDVAVLYSDIFLNSLIASGYDPNLLIIQAGEEQKTPESIALIHDAAYSAQLERGSLMIALGGGVVGDMTAFAAATWLRGISVVQVPTTLLAMVDASIGGKTGVNHPMGKNLIGSFHQPRLVLIDINTLQTLPEREFRSGMAEIIKYGLIADKKFYNTVKSNFIKLIRLENIDQIESIIYQCCKHKINFFIDDEFDYNKRMILNFGHTIGHAIESYYNYKNISHGEAVYYGMIASAFISHKHGLLIESDFNHIYDFIFNIPKVGLNNLDSEKVYKYIKYDKKRMGNKNYFILLNDIGKADIVENVTSDDIKEAITFIANYEYSCN